MVDPNTPDNMPISEAVQQLAIGIHNDIIAGLHDADQLAGPDFDQQPDRYREAYPSLLFGNLALSIAGIELPENATTIERSKGIVEALRRITTTPALFEKVTNVPFSNEQAATLAPGLAEAQPADQEELELVESIRQQVNKNGYLDREMLPTGRLLQLHYATPAHTKKGVFGKKDVQASTTGLKLAATADRGFEVALYQSRDSNGYYHKKLGTRRHPLPSTFRLVAVDHSEGPLKRLDRLIGETVRIGNVSTGSPLQLEAYFKHVINEVEGYEVPHTSYTETTNAKLQQAYLGNSLKYPLFLH